MKTMNLLLIALLVLTWSPKGRTQGASILQDSTTQIETRAGKWQRFLDPSQIKQNPTLVNISSSAAAFYVLGALQVMYRMAAEPEKDAEMLKNFFTNQVFSAQAFISISMYSIGVQSVNSAFHTFAVKNNWIKDELNIQRVMAGLAQQKNLPGHPGILTQPKGYTPELISEWKKVRAQAEKSIPGRFSANRFAKVSLLTSFSVALPLVTVFSDLLADPDIQFYAESLISSPEKVNQMIREKNITPLEAHERAYQRWVVGNKIADYTPALLSAWTALSIQLFAIPQIVKASGLLIEKFTGAAPTALKPYLVKGIQLARSGVHYVPQGKLASIVGNGIVFLSLNELLSKPFQRIYDNFTYRKRLTESKTLVQQTQLRPEIGSSCLATLKKNPQFSVSTLNATPYSTLRKVLLLEDVDGCSDLPPSLSEELESMSTAYSQWRHLHLSEKLAPLNLWAAHTAQALNDYSTSEYLYRELVQAVKTNDKFLTHHDAFYGLGKVTADGKSDNTAAKLAETIQLLKRQIEASQSTSPPQNGFDRKVLILYNRMDRFLSVLLSSYKKPEFLTKWLNGINFNKTQDSSQMTSQKMTGNRLVEIYAGNAFFEFQDFIKNNAKDITGYQRYEFDKLWAHAQDTTPKAPGEFWMNTIRYKLANSPFRAYPEAVSVQGLSVRNNFEYILTQALCSNNESAHIKSIPFWSLNLSLPLLLDATDKIDCSKATQSLLWPDQEKNIFKSNLESEVPRYVNLFDLGTAKLQAKINNANFDFESWWQSKVGGPADKEFQEKATRVRVLYETSIRPALFTSSGAETEEIGLTASLLQEIKMYTDVLKTRVLNNSTAFDAYWSVATTVTALVTKAPSDQNLAGILQTSGWNKSLGTGTETDTPKSAKERYLWVNRVGTNLIESARKYALENTDVSKLNPDQQILLLQARTAIESRIKQILEISKFPLLFSIQNKDQP
ncbi:MAG: hypothetical protein JNL11_09600 [Bdellovibrionaceae bacterium]|nr:hypothetical protein [Pseudobdellovibrionaceae bacterium]